MWEVYVTASLLGIEEAWRSEGSGALVGLLVEVVLDDCPLAIKKESRG
jgi:hypothetical protein